MRGRRSRREALSKLLDDPERAKLQDVHVLVVDDSRVNVELARHILISAGATVSVAHNGADAIELLSTSASSYDLVLMDIYMPVLDGLEATRRIRKTLGLSELPIVAITAGELHSEGQLAVAAGMNDFITKPFEPHTMICALQRQLSKAVVPLSIPPPTDASLPPADWPVLEGMNTAATFARFGGDRRLLKQILQHFFDELEALPSSAVSGSTLASRLHKLAGAAAMLGAAALRTAASDAERIARVDPEQGLSETNLNVLPQLRRLRESAAVLMAAQERSASATSDRAVNRVQLDELIDLLSRHRVDALDVFDRVATCVQAELGQEAFSELDRAINALDYKRALQFLEKLGARKR